MEAQESTVWRFADAEVDEAARELRVGGEVMDMEPRPFDLLLMLLRSAGEVVRNEDIITHAWSARVINQTSYLNVSNAISKLRKALRDSDHEIITTHPRKGYRLSAAVERFARKGPPQEFRLAVDRPVPGRPLWRLTEHLDTGGFGEVWVATNVNTQDQRVFKFCMDTDRLSALKRESTLFRMLKETLGDRAPVPTLLEWQLETPPYYLESERWGCDLRAWTDNLGGLPRLSLETRLQLMVLTTEVVAAIHAVGVLHKDLKPQNILVRGDVDHPEVRLCDLGAGTLLDEAVLQNLNITRQGFTQTVGNAGTPIYLAPEIQAGGLPSIQSDVYSLGVMLYQLAVCDWRPLAFGWENDIDDELLREDIAACIGRDPNARPPSATIVAQRIRRLAERREELMQSRAEAARHREVAEALKRTRARRPWLIAVVSTLVMAAIVSSFLTLQARRAAERAAENERVARAVADFLVNDIVRQSSPDYGGHVDVTLKTAMLNSVPKISERLSGPVAAELNQSLAEILASLSAPSEAVSLARNSAQQYAQLYGPNDRRTLAAKMDEISYRLLLEPGPRLIAELDALSPETSKLEKTDPTSIKAAMARAWLRTYVEGRVEDALPAFSEVISSLEGLTSKESDLARLMYLRHLVLAGRYDQARNEVRRLLPQFEMRYGSNSRHTLQLHLLLGRTFEAERESTHDFPAAEQEYEMVITGLRDLYGPESGEVDQVRMDLGDLYINTERWREAETLERELLSRFEAKLGPDSFYTWRTRLTLLVVLNSIAADEPAYINIALSESTNYLALARATKPVSHHYCRLLLWTADTMRLAKRFGDAKSLLDELDLLVQTAPDDLERRYFKGTSDYQRGLLAIEEGEPEAAKRYFALSMENLPAVFGDKHPLIQEIRYRLEGGQVANPKIW